jgi:secreted Zn-dependent insulinase-like peptidase
MSQEVSETPKPQEPESSPPEQSTTSNSSENNVFLWVLIGGLVLIAIVVAIVYFSDFSKKDDFKIEDLTIVQPFVENNEFKTFTLPNGLQVLLSKSNDGMQNSFVALTVGVGSQTDPEDFCGFTHLIEHLLFTGSQNYPEDDYIVKIINKHNGEDNGVTKSFTTSYYYKIGPGGLAEFAPVLADAVAFPNFDKDKIKKEINNVNSEISMRMLYNKNLAYYKTIKKMGNPDARIFRDGFAGIETDKIDVEELHKKIKDFHKKYYSANIMTLAIITDEDLNDVEKIVRKSFQFIPNKLIERPTHEFEEPYQPPFLPSVYNRVVYLQGFSKPAQLSLIFEVNAERKYKWFHPLEYFSFFLNYYSENSLKDKLIREGMITGFDDELVLQDFKRGIYMIQFDLTKKGETSQSYIIAEFFKFVDFIKNLKDYHKIYQEASNFSKFSFLFNISSEFMMFPEVEQNNFERVLEFSEKMLQFGSRNVFTANQVWLKFDRTSFERVFVDLDIDKMIVFIESEDFKTSEEKDIMQWEISDFNGEKESKRAIIALQKGEGPTAAGNEEVDDNNKNIEAGRVLEEVHDQTGDNASFGDHHSDEVLNTEDATVSRDEEIVDEAPHVDSEKHVKETSSGRDSHGRFKHVFFDSSISYIRTFYAFDFDNNRQFMYERIPADAINAIKKEVNRKPAQFDDIKSLEIEKYLAYDMITNCNVPHDIGNDLGPVEDITKQNKDPLEVKTPDQHSDEQHKLKFELKSYENNINVARIFKILFDYSNKEHILTQKMLIIRSLLVYKICLIDEFNDDDKKITADVIEETPRLKNYYKMYRKTLQPVNSMRVMIENPYFQNNIIKGTSEEKQKFYLKIELLCLYIKHHLSLKFIKDFMKGNDLSISSHSYALYFTFMGLSMAQNEFIEKMLSATEELLQPDNYDMSILQNLQKRIVNNYSNFSTMTSLKVSTYLLDLMIDELTMDIRSEENLNQIRDWVHEITPQDLADTYAKIQSQNKLTILQAGNVMDTTAKIQTNIVRKYFLKDEDDTNVNVGNIFSESINKVLDNMLLRFGGQNHHFMVRVPNLDPEDKNSVYVTYFRSEKETVKVKLIGTMVSHWMRPFVFDRLRNQKNLGYVAYESIREYYYRTGQMILIQGEKFRPTEIEGLIEDTIRDFQKELQNKSQGDLDDLKNILIKEYTEFTNDLGDVTSKLWDFIEEEYILDEKQDYETIASKITLDEILKYYQTTFFDNQRRITLQLFAHELKPEEQSFVIDPKKRLVDLDYQIKSLDEMIQMRKDSVKTFRSRKLKQMDPGN